MIPNDIDDEITVEQALTWVEQFDTQIIEKLQPFLGRKNTPGIRFEIATALADIRVYEILSTKPHG